MAGTGEQNPADKTKAKLKKQGDDIYEFGGQLSKASKISESKFRDWCDQFEGGFVDKTPEPNDSPYGLPASNRPKITIL